MKMKRVVPTLLMIALLLTGCATIRTDVTREEVVAAYEAAGYEVWTGAYAEKLDNGPVAYVQADHPDGDYIYFAFFETEAEAKAYEKELDHPVMMYVFSWIFGDPSWERMETYGCVVVSYDDPDLFIPFKNLLKVEET